MNSLCTFKNEVLLEITSGVPLNEDLKIWKLYKAVSLKKKKISKRSEAEFKEFEFKFMPRLKYGWFNLNLY